MNAFQHTKLTLSVTAFILGAAMPMPGFAQMAVDHSQHGQMATSAKRGSADMADGEVRKLDLETGKVTLKHGEIKSLDMPPMTMIFSASDKAMLAPLKVGDKVRFKVVHEAGKYVVTDIQPGQ